MGGFDVSSVLNKAIPLATYFMFSFRISYEEADKTEPPHEVFEEVATNLEHSVVVRKVIHIQNSNNYRETRTDAIRPNKNALHKKLR